MEKVLLKIIVVTNKIMLKKMCELNYNFYIKKVGVFKQPSLMDVIKNENAVYGYRVVSDVSFEGLFYYLLLIFSDGTGFFKYMFDETEFYNNGKTSINECKTLSVDETNNILKVINDNDFYSIPVMPLKELTVVVFDGTRIYIEGYNGKDIHFVSTSMPEESTNISDIYEAFKKFGENL